MSSQQIDRIAREALQYGEEQSLLGIFPYESATNSARRAAQQARRGQAGGGRGTTQEARRGNEEGGPQAIPIDEYDALFDDFVPDWDEEGHNEDFDSEDEDEEILELEEPVAITDLKNPTKRMKVRI